MAVFETGEGPDELRVSFSADAFEGNPHLNLFVLPDGEYTGNAFEFAEVSASRAAGETDTFVIRGDWGPSEVFELTPFGFTFVDDLYAGPGEDRNLYLESASINGVDLDVSADAAAGGDYGPFWFNGDAVAPEPTPDPDPEPEPEPEPVPGIVVNGTAGADVLYGSEGDDVIAGLGGDDGLNGKGGNDVLRGGAGSDVFVGGAGDDTVTTNSGRDVVIFSPGDGHDTVTDFADDFDSVWIGGGKTVTDMAVRAETRDGVDGSLLYFTGDPDSGVFLPGVDAAALGFVTILA